MGIRIVFNSTACVIKIMKLGLICITDEEFDEILSFSVFVFFCTSGPSSMVFFFSSFWLMKKKKS